MTEKALSVFATTIIVMARIMPEPFMILRGRDAENPGLQLRDKNFITRDIVLNDEGTVRYFRRKIDLMAYAFAKSGLEKSRIFYNSLSTPFFLINGLKRSAKRDVLLWQEPLICTNSDRIEHCHELVRAHKRMWSMSFFKNVIFILI